MNLTNCPLAKVIALSLAPALAGLSFFGADSASAASATWTGAADAVWADGNWGGASPVPGTGDTATFNSVNNGNATIDLSSTGVTINTIIFNNAAAYTIGAGAVGSQTLTLNDGGAITVNSNTTNNELFNANLLLGTATAGSYTLTNNSTSGVLTLSGTVQGGTGGTAGAKTLTVASAGNTTISGIIANGGASSLALTRSGAGTLTLTGNNTYTGATTISAGTLQIGNGTTDGSISSSASIANSGSLIFNLVGSQTYANIISGAGTLTKSGSGTLTLSGRSTFTGGTIVNSGTLTLQGSNNGTGDIRGTLTINSGATVQATTNSNAFGFTAGAKVDAVNINGGTLINAFNGDLGWGVAYTLTGGTMQATAGAFAFGGNSATTDTSVTTLASATISTISGLVNLRNDNNPTTVNFTVADGAAATDLLVSAVLANVTGGGGSSTPGITKSGAGTMVLSGANTYTGQRSSMAALCRLVTARAAV